MVIFCEGTRFTPAKHAKSVAYCQEHGLTPFKHLLYPRVKGFQLMREELHGAEEILHVTFAFPHGVPTLRDLIFDARSIEVHVHVNSEPIAACPVGDQGCSDYVVRTYAAMDARLEHHAKAKIYAEPEFVRPKTLSPLIVSLGWSALFAGILGWTLAPRVLAGDYFALLIAGAFYALGYGMVQLGLWFTKRGKHGPSPKAKQQ
jgi:hypothetical protein